MTYRTYRDLKHRSLSPNERDIVDSTHLEVKSVKSEGAAGDGVKKDTADIQRTLDTADVIIVPPGTYLVAASFSYAHEGGTVWTGALDVPSDRVIIIQEGATFISEESVAGYRGMFVVRGKTNVRFTGGGLFDGRLESGLGNVATAVDAGISVHSSSNVTIANLSAQDFAQHGFAFYADQSVGCVNCEFRNLLVDNGNNTCLMAYSSVAVRGDAPNKHIRAINCEVKNAATNFGIEFRGCQQSLISGCRSLDNEDGGYHIEERYLDVHVVDCESTSETGSGFVCAGDSSADRCIFERCRASSNGAGGFSHTSDSPHTKYIDCVSESNTGLGINIADAQSTECEIIRTRVTGNTGGGVSVAADDCIIRDSDLTGNTTTDLSINAQRVETTNCTIPNVSYNNSNQKIGGSRIEIADTNHETILHLLSRFIENDELVRIVGTRQSDGNPYGALEFVRTGASGAETRVYSVNAGSLKYVAGFQVDGDVEMQTADRGVVVVTPDGTQKYRINVDNAGLVQSTLV